MGVMLYNYKSNIKDHHNKYNNNKTVWNIVSTTQMWHKYMKWANAVGKILPIDTQCRGCHKPSISIKCNIFKAQ